MKKVLIAVFVAGMFSACTKQKDDVQQNPPTPATKPSLKRDVTAVDGSMQVPKVDTVLYSGIFDVGSANGLVATGAKVNFTYTGAFKPAEDLQNVYFVIKDGTTEVYRSEKKITVVNGENSFAQLSKNLLRTKSYVIEIHADVLSSATDGTGVEDQCTVGFYLIYWSGENSTEQNTGWIGGQKTTFSNIVSNSSTVQVSNNSSSALSQYILGNQEFEVSKIDLKSVGGTSILTQEKFFVGGNSSVIGTISAVKVYDGTTLLGSGTVSGQIATVNFNLNLPENVIKTLSVKVVIGSVGVDASGYSFDVTSDNITYTDAGGLVKVNDFDVISNKFTLLKAMQTISSIPLSGNLQNGVLTDLCKITILSIGGNTATKQITYKVTLTDNGTHIDSLSCKNLYLKVAGSTVANVRFTNTAGQIIDSVGPGDNIVRVTFISGSHEYMNQSSVPVEYIFGGRFVGFNHQSSDGDVGSVESVFSDNATTLRYVNSGVAPNNLNAKLYSSQTANAGAVIQNYIWSDLSAGSAHSFAFGSGTADAKNGSGGVTVNTNPQVWLRR